MKVSEKAEKKHYLKFKMYRKLLKLPLPHKTWMNIYDKAYKNLTKAPNEARRRVGLS